MNPYQRMVEAAGLKAGPMARRMAQNPNREQQRDMAGTEKRISQKLGVKTKTNPETLAQQTLKSRRAASRKAGESAAYDSARTNISRSIADKREGQ